jgi:chromosome segregation ATPase
LPEEVKPSEKVGDKFKLSILQMEKRFVDLEVALCELNEKLKVLDAAAVSELKQRVDDVEDLIMVEQAGILELKKMLEEAQEKAKEPQAAPSAVTISPEELEKIASTVTVKWEERLIGLEKKLAAIEIPQNVTFPEADELRKQIQSLTNQLKNLEFTMNSELGYVKEKMITEDLVQTIVAEISDLRTEYGREVREIKEKVGSAPLYADIQFLSNRVKDLKQAVDNLLNMKVEIDSKILNLERSLVEMEGAKLPSGLDREIDNTKRELIANGKKILALERTVQEASKKFESLNVGEIGKKLEMIREVETLYSRINEIYSDLQRKVDSISKLTPINVESKIRGLEEKIDEVQYSMKDLDNKVAKQEIPTHVFDSQVSELMEKMIFLETRLRALERMMQQPTKAEPIILE